jgi:3'-5' exonuclease
MPHEKLLVFDIETVPDPRHAKGTEFPPPALHQIVAIAFLEADITRDGSNEKYILRDLRAGGEIRFQEKELLQGFVQYLERLRPRLVTYNGRGFDIPVVKYRSMVHQLQAPLLSHSDYSYRYNTDSHCDLLEMLSDFGASTRMRLADLCSALGVPSKLGMDGSEVQRNYQAGNLQAIRDYCEIDVVNTYLVYLRTMFNRGTVSPLDYEHAMTQLREYLTINSQGRRHFAEFLKGWAYVPR